MRFRGTLTFFILVTGLGFALSAWSQQKPFTQEQVSNMVRDGFGDESGAKLIEQRGIDFAPAADFLQTLKAAGASEAFLKALGAAQTPEPASAKQPLNQVQVIALLAGGVPSHRVTMLVEDRGVDFEPTEDYLRDIRLPGVAEELITALKNAKVILPATADSAAEARQTEVRKHMARGMEFWRSTRYGDAEAEYREAIRLDPENADLHGALAPCLSDEGQNEEAVAEAKEALRLAPNSETAHYGLGYVLLAKRDLPGAETELREAIRLSADDDNAHVALANALWGKGDCEAAVAEAREAIRLDQGSSWAHSTLGSLLGSCKGDWTAGIAEIREGLRLNPNDETVHSTLAGALRAKGDLDGAISEYREALRLNPKRDYLHISIGTALGEKGDWDGDIAEQREALRLNPNSASARGGLGFALYKKGDLRGALGEFRAAYTLDPKNATYKQNYEGLLQQVNQ